MLWGQKIRVYTDHKNLVRDALGLTSNRVFHWRLTLEEYNPEIIYIKGVDNTVADAISRLEYDPSVNVKSVHWSERWCCFVKLLADYEPGPTEPPQTHGGEPRDCHSIMRDIRDVSHLYVTLGDEEEEIYPPTIAQIAQEQRRSRAKHTGQ